MDEKKLTWSQKHQGLSILIVVAFACIVTFFIFKPWFIPDSSPEAQESRIYTECYNAAMRAVEEKVGGSLSFPKAYEAGVQIGRIGDSFVVRGYAYKGGLDKVLYRVDLTNTNSKFTIDKVEVN